MKSMSVIDPIRSVSSYDDHSRRLSRPSGSPPPHPLLPGHAAVTLETSAVRAVVAPSSGGRIASLVDRRSGTEWMWAPPGGRPRDRRRGASFAESPMLGADECIPTVGECTVDGINYADHGEVWQRRWSSVSDHAPVSCTHAVGMTLHGLRLERHARVDGARLHLDYTVERTRESTVPWLWSWHPLFTMPTCPRLELEGVRGSPRVQACSGIDADNPILRSPLGSSTSGVSRLDLGAPQRSAKLFFAAEPQGLAKLSDDATGESITVRWKGEALQGFGLWINRGGWNGYHHVALEPCTVPFESPADMPDPGACPSQASWSLEIELGASTSDMQKPN